MDTAPDSPIAIMAFDILHSRRLQHFNSIIHHVNPHLTLILLPFGIDVQYIQPPFVLLCLVQRHLIFMIRKYLAKSPDIHSPRTWLCQRLLVFLSNGVFRYLMIIPFTASSTLIAKATQIIPFVAKKIAIPGNIDTIGASAEIILVLITLYMSAGAHTQMMVHQVMPQFAAAAAQSVGPYIRSGIHQYPGAVQRRRIQENDLCKILVGLVRFRIQYLYARCLLFIFIIQDLGDNGPGTQCKLACLHRSRQRRRLCAEISPKWTAQRAFVPELAAGPSAMRYGDIGRPADDHMSHALVMLLYPGRNILLHARHIIRRQVLTIR